MLFYLCLWLILKLIKILKILKFYLITFAQAYSWALLYKFCTASDLTPILRRGKKGTHFFLWPPQDGWKHLPKHQTQVYNVFWRFALSMSFMKYSSLTLDRTIGEQVFCTLKQKYQWKKTIPGTKGTPSICPFVKRILIDFLRKIYEWKMKKLSPILLSS